MLFLPSCKLPLDAAVSCSGLAGFLTKVDWSRLFERDSSVLQVWEGEWVVRAAFSPATSQDLDWMLHPACLAAGSRGSTCRGLDGHLQRATSICRKAFGAIRMRVRTRVGEKSENSFCNDSISLPDITECFQACPLW